MKLETLILYAIISVVLIGIPTLLAKKFGKNPMELLFGERVNRTIFGKKEKKDPQDKKKQGNPKNDLLTLVSNLATYARKNHFQLIVPGTLSHNGTVAVLTAILITRSKVVGINCFGFSGSITARAGNKDWMQLLDGEQHPFPSPVKKNQNQEAIVRQVLEDTGFTGTEVEIIGIFTSPTVKLFSVTGTNCYTKNDAMAYLNSECFLKDTGLDPAKIEQALAPKIVRTRGTTEKQEQA